jgi:isopenicillin-N N-acyltransferase-like protein
MHEFPLISVAGNSYDMGYQHGVQAADLIVKYILWIEKSNRKDRSELGHNALAFLPLIEQLSPALVEEIRGLAAGANIPFEEALLCQTRGATAQAQPEGCTAFSLTGTATATGHPLAGQNQDLPPEFSDLGIVLHLKPNDGRPRAITFTFAGQLGYMGMNQNGIAHFANGLGNAPWQMGLPHYPLKRVLLEKRTVAECIELLKEFRLCSPGNMVFCDGQGAIADVEIRPEGIALYEDEHPDRRLHTNHYITPEFAPHETYDLEDSCPRLERIRQLVQTHWGKITVDTLKTILADHHNDPGAICRHGGKGIHSIAGYIAEPEKNLFHVRRGHGCIGTWKAYEV